MEDPQEPPQPQGHREYVILDEVAWIPDLPPLTLAQRLELDTHLFGVCFVKLTEDGPVRVNPREVTSE